MDGIEVIGGISVLGTVPLSGAPPKKSNVFATTKKSAAAPKRIAVPMPIPLETQQRRHPAFCCILEGTKGLPNTFKLCWVSSNPAWSPIARRIFAAWFNNSRA
jgi:hypothetical protein